MWKKGKWRLILVALLDVFFPSGKPGDRWRGGLMGPLLKKCGKNFCVKKGVHFVAPEIVSVGDNVYIGNYVNIGAGKEIVIGDEVILGPLCAIYAQNHAAKNGSYRFGLPMRGTVKIGKGSWIGSHVVLLPGADIGSGCLVAAGVLVREKVADGSMVMNMCKNRQIPLVLEEGLME